MARKIEHLLRAMADYDAFTQMNTEVKQVSPEDLSFEELDMVFAAAGVSSHTGEEKGKDKPINMTRS